MFGVFITVIHVIVCLGMILVILLQAGKGGGLAGSVGGMMSGANLAFGGRGTSDILTRATTVFAVLFMILSLTLSVYTLKSSSGTESSSKVRELLNSQQPTTAQPFNAVKPQTEQIEKNEQPPVVTPAPTSSTTPAPSTATTSATTPPAATTPAPTTATTPAPSAPGSSNK